MGNRLSDLLQGPNPEEIADLQIKHSIVGIEVHRCLIRPINLPYLLRRGGATTLFVATC